MKKIVTIMLVVSLLTLGGCGKTETVPEESATVIESSVPDIEESSEEPEVEEERPVDFDFMKGEEVNAEAIINHAQELGLLEHTWKEAKELDPDDIVNAHLKKNQEKYESFAENNQEYSSYIVQIPEEEMDEVVTTFVDIPLDTLHEAEHYKESNNAYEFELPVVKEESAEETEEEWPVEVSEVLSLGEDVYEIVLVDAANEDAPVAFGTLTVENNDNVPKYLSFIKPEEVVSEQPTSGTTTGGGTGGTTTGGTTSGGGTGGTAVGSTGGATTGGSTGGTTTGGGTGGTTSGGGTGGTTSGGGTGGTSSDAGTGSGNPYGLGSAWDGVELPGDPNIETYTFHDRSGYNWTY